MQVRKEVLVSSTVYSNSRGYIKVDDGVLTNVSDVVYGECRSEERSCAEETSSDTENERVFPESETKKRRMSFDKKNCKPGLCRRPSLPVLSGKENRRPHKAVWQLSIYR